ncbi:23S rRNA (pseudouridine(1915)-N(3))-methyltransferase RlmH [Bosea caraganae]|uniref:Ribosomal RNA large subunit methyltransferase H n=1 Tax=Bosea caraganae TaxID=2763117 RepID=A0A370L9N7_9HYPH|nr:23S rRNA (pseudouridine(1915)-N(3))-methyltransferase RlmH [Bosea caraganae]RDJ21930.1 23S rRNA (pseudouridine(1915)-N(3))-methyltransferase RlmH [Bosea caraganae]RDJ28038.1 23S rRNA (pseudouridine(1915)-N(3))-methyltransferase RlmH [Bosea caraganae]
MRLAIIAVGRLKDGPERELCERYRERALQLGRGLGLSGPEIVEITEGKGRRSDERKREEATAILGKLSPGLLIALDERGRSISSEAFAAKIAAARDGGTAAASLVIGGADGLAEEIRDRADITLAFGALTIPHQLVRVLALEQLYRAMTIVAGHPYHRA